MTDHFSITKQIHREQLKILSISIATCIIVAGICFAIIKIAVYVSVPLTWSVGETGIYQAIMIIGGIVAIAGIGVVGVITLGGMFVMATLIIKEDEDIQ